MTVASPHHKEIFRSRFFYPRLRHKCLDPGTTSGEFSMEINLVGLRNSEYWYWYLLLKASHQFSRSYCSTGLSWFWNIHHAAWSVLQAVRVRYFLLLKCLGLTLYKQIHFCQGINCCKYNLRRPLGRSCLDGICRFDIVQEKFSPWYKRIFLRRTEGPDRLPWQSWKNN